MNNNIDKSKLLNSSLSDAVKKGDKDALLNSLSKEDKEKLNAVLNDKNALNAALKSPEAMAIMKALFGGKNG